MNAYFNTNHVAALLFLVTISAWGPALAIRLEEAALLTTLGDRYRAYAAQHKRLVPLVW